MALFSFGKKEKKTGGKLSDQVIAMRQQGYPDEQIIQMLQSQGYKSSEIYDALSQGDIASGAPVGPSFSEPSPSGPMPPPGPYAYEQQQEQPMQQEPAQQTEDREKVEQIAEAIIDEKWKEIAKDMGRMMELNRKTELRLVKIEADIKNLKENFDSLHKGVLGKITEYDQNLVNVGTEIKAMEKVFQKILPTFTENVSKLSRLTEGIGKKK